MKRLGILLSGRGSNFLAILRHIRAGRLRAEIACVLSDVADAPGLAAARAAGLPAFFVDPAGRRRAEYEDEMAGLLERHGADLVCLAGYMRILGRRMLERFPGRILNIHPSLLPAFPGLHAQRQALERGVRFAGCTVHRVDAGVDSGPIIRQTVVPVLEGDTEETLSARILEMEHATYWKAIRDVLLKESDA
ncbi:MAG: phosphoribosylglycinamide formyltransferase [Acidobacteria bacterium]|nr:phosphoribosylglycinamide formyltransferase [Acidobacteriota bacterium]